MNFFKLLWILQKLLARVPIKLIKADFKISARTINSNNITCIYKSNELVANSSYKITHGNEFRRILKVDNSVLNTKTGVIWSNNKLLLESTFWNYEDLLRWEPRPFAPKRLHGNYYSLPDNGFYHFLIEDLPRYIQAKNFGGDCKTLIGKESRYLTEVISLLSPGNAKLISYPVRIESLYISEKIKESLFSTEDLKILHSRFAEFRKFYHGFRIFISRKDHKGSKYLARGLTKKNEIENFFKDLGFKIVYLEDLSFSQQIELCSHAEIIAGFHGAGLSNIVWADSGIKVIEITNTRVTTHFEHLSKICGHKFLRFSIQSNLSDVHRFIN